VRVNNTYFVKELVLIAAEQYLFFIQVLGTLGAIADTKCIVGFGH